MAVQLPNCRLGVRRRTKAYDEHGFPVPDQPSDLVGPFPARKSERADGTWSLALAPECWPVDERSVVIEPDTDQVWTVVTADLLTNNVTPIVDYVRVDAHERIAGHTEP